MTTPRFTTPHVIHNDPAAQPMSWPEVIAICVVSLIICGVCVFLTLSQVFGWMAF